MSSHRKHDSVPRNPKDQYKHDKPVTGTGRFRLFYLLPDLNEADIEVEFFRASLIEGTPSYRALSYAWGSQSPLKYVSVREGGRTLWISVTPNLEDALRQLRHPTERRAYWIDALCIDQDKSNSEKEAQIKRMGEIYGKAEEVVVWLGRGADSSNLAMDFVPKVSDLSRLDSLVKDSYYCQQWRALGALMRRPWFSRRWVVQELALAREATVLCGPQQVKWHDFADAVALFEANSLAIQRLFNNENYAIGEIRGLGAYGLITASHNLLAQANDETSKHSLITLEYLVSTLSVFQVSNPWDTVYALLSLVKPTQRDKILVDYNKPLDEVFKDVIEITIEDSRSVDIICRPWAPLTSQILAWFNRPTANSAASRGKNYRPPSWIRDISENEFGPRSDREGVQFDRLNARKFVGLPGSPIYNTSRGTEADVSFILEPSPILVVRGFKLEGIDSEGIGGFAQQGNIPPDWLGLGSWKEHVKRRAPEEFWRTLVADRGLDGSRPPVWYRRACEHAWAHKPYPGLDTATTIKYCRSLMTVEFLTRVQQTVWNRQMFLTKNRKLLGLGPSNHLSSQTIKGGDIICILQGCSVPLILRQHSSKNSYYLIGECYVHGVMDGEAVALYQEVDRKFQEIWLR